MGAFLSAGAPTYSWQKQPCLGHADEEDEEPRADLPRACGPTPGRGAAGTLLPAGGSRKARGGGLAKAASAPACLSPPPSSREHPPGERTAGLGGL